MTTERWEIGPEYDESLFRRLSDVLKDMGFDLAKSWSGVGGSQEVSQWTIASECGTLMIEAETYIGFSIEGPAELVQRVRENFDAKNGL